MGILQDSSLVVIGAIVALGPNLLTERLKTRQAEQVYWRDQRRSTYTSFLGHCSRLENDTVRIGRLVQGLGPAGGEDPARFRHPELIGDAALRSAVTERNVSAELMTDDYETIKLIGSSAVAQQARDLVAALNTLVELARDGRFEVDPAWQEARQALRAGRDGLRAAAREELRVEAP